MFSMENRQCWSQNVLYIKMFSILKSDKNVSSTCYIMLFSTVIEIEIHVKKGLKNQKVFFMKFEARVKCSL